MRPTGCPRARALLCFYFLFNIAFAGLAQPARRDETSLTTQPPPSETLGDEGREAAVTSGTLTEFPGAEPTVSFSASGTPASPSLPQGTSTVNSTILESTVPEDDLPLEPEITPGFAVAGVILVATGVVYAVVGIKTRWIHSFLSTAFLGSLGTSVLIVYVMTPPVGRAIQGAYVVAVVCTGLILGGLAIVFKEITECLACLLGGFCLSMWLLTLQPGGVIHQTGGKVGFIAAFTLAGFGLYFTPWTRTYGMIACISFSGATVAVLGIDCFSRAGYKEFWAYLWALNDDLFPLGTSSYPLTRGIRVEIAVTILIFLAGVVSQLKLWRIIKDRRSKRDAERAEGERTLRAEEENVGRQVEEMTARERRRWERIYGDGATSPLGGSADSGVGDMESEKRVHLRNSVVSASALGVRSQSPAGTENTGTGILELSIDEAMTPFHMPKIVAAERVISKDDNGARITVMVAQDDMPSGPIFEEIRGPAKEAQTVGALEGGSKQREYTIPSAWQSNSLTLELSPNITPLPFTVPKEEDNEGVEEDRSLIATFAEDEQDEPRPRPRQPREGFGDRLTRRLSGGSAKGLGSLAQRSKRNKDEQNGVEAEEGESREELVIEIPRAAATKDESDSVAANLDDLSYVSDLVSFHSWETPKEYQLDTRLDGKAEGGMADGQQGTPGSDNVAPANWAFGSDRIQFDGLNVPSNPVYSSLTAGKSGAALGGAGAQTGDDSARTKEEGTRPEQAVPAQDGEERDADMRRTSIDSVAASLTKGNLPSGLSRVAMSYRTNEWAKHLSVADTPEPETLQVEEAGEDSYSDAASEGAVPLDVAELQQTAENAAPPPAAPRSASSLSNYHTLARSGSRTSLSGQPYRSLSGTLKGKASGLLAQPIAEEGGDGDADRDGTSNGHSSNNGPLVPPAVPEEGSLTSGSRYETPSPGPRELTSSASTPNLAAWLGFSQQSQTQPQQQQQQQTSTTPQTLMGMREMLLRTKASAGLLTTPTPAEALFTNLSNPDLLLHGTPSEAGSINNYPLYSAGVGANIADSPTTTTPIDADDIPLSQRRAMIRQSASLGSFSNVKPSSQQPYRSQSRTSMQGLYSSNNNTNHNSTSTSSNSKGQTPTAEAAAFDSHQPARKSNVPTEAVRQAQLANFRSSVAADLRAVTPIDGAVNPSAAGSGYTTPGGGWDSPLLGPVLTMNHGHIYGHGHGPGHGSPAMLNPSFGALPQAVPGGFAFHGAAGQGGGGGVGGGLMGSASMQSLRGAYNNNLHTNIGVNGVSMGIGPGPGGMADVQRTLETQRSFMMGQKEMEMARREAERIEAERGQREFEERMRSGQLMEAHRDALRRMQAKARE